VCVPLASCYTLVNNQFVRPVSDSRFSCLNLPPPPPPKVANAVPAGYRATSSKDAAPRDPFSSGSDGLSDDEAARERDREVHASDDARAGPPDDLAAILAGGGGEDDEAGPWAFKICDRHAPTPSTPQPQNPTP